MFLPKLQQPHQSWWGFFMFGYVPESTQSRLWFLRISERHRQNRTTLLIDNLDHEVVLLLGRQFIPIGDNPL